MPRESAQPTMISEVLRRPYKIRSRLGRQRSPTRRQLCRDLTTQNEALAIFYDRQTHIDAASLGTTRLAIVHHAEISAELTAARATMQAQERSLAALAATRSESPSSDTSLEARSHVVTVAILRRLAQIFHERRAHPTDVNGLSETFTHWDGTRCQATDLMAYRILAIPRLKNNTTFGMMAKSIRRQITAISPRFSHLASEDIKSFDLVDNSLIDRRTHCVIERLRLQGHANKMPSHLITAGENSHMASVFDILRPIDAAKRHLRPFYCSSKDRPGCCGPAVITIANQLYNAGFRDAQCFPKRHDLAGESDHVTFSFLVRSVTSTCSPVIIDLMDSETNQWTIQNTPPSLDS
ncbi:hypothetical protein Micbo1qcDRAFT_180223 [Microdochium bolleyi]|uniref:Uncharacterized protein n=1 Tax=Microdochium bolleyi TaxID=196109 RepID=A0A136IM16_9PEZI|nr:hypothetical protein Micbo1qcDRAFT_180223 [Microdochium bolleyi]